MRFCRFGEGRFGLVEGTVVRDVTAALDVLPSYRYPLPRQDGFIAHLESVRSPVPAVAPAASIPLNQLVLRSPVANPGKIIAAPVNYAKHLDEVRTDVQLSANNPAN